MNAVKNQFGINECQYMKKFIACDNSIPSDVKEMIKQNMSMGCAPKHMTCDTDNDD